MIKRAVLLVVPVFLAGCYTAPPNYDVCWKDAYASGVLHLPPSPPDISYGGGAPVAAPTAPAPTPPTPAVAPVAAAEPTPPPLLPILDPTPVPAKLPPPTPLISATPAMERDDTETNAVTNAAKARPARQQAPRGGVRVKRKK